MNTYMHKDSVGSKLYPVHMYIKYRGMRIQEAEFYVHVSTKNP